MPKLILNLRDNILSSAKTILFDKGYQELNMRMLAKLNNTAVGTIYNYFPSKDLLVASIVAEDWHLKMNEIKEVSKSVSTFDEGIEKIILIINSFYSMYRNVFRSSGLKNVREEYPDKYDLLISSIGFEIEELLRHFNISFTDFEITFIVTNIFVSVTNDWPYEQTIHILKKIVKEN